MTSNLNWNEAVQKCNDIERALNESSIVSIADHRGVIQFVNDKFCEISQYSKEELIGSKQSILNSNYHDDVFYKELWETVSAGNVWKGIIRNMAKDGTYYWLDTTIVPYLDKNGQPYQYIAIRHDVTRLKEYKQTIEEMAFYDQITMLPNRNALNDWVEKSTIEADQFYVLYIDMDRFKKKNNMYGHAVGDMLLREVAQRLKEVVRSTDFVARQGGDEFIILLNGAINKDEVINISQAILKQCSLPFCLSGKQIFLTPSIGISTSISQKLSENHLQLVELLIKQANTAMYAAKQKGGNTYSFNTHDQNNKVQRFYYIEREIGQALFKEEFFIVYQPIMNIHQEKIVGVEALLRWKNPRLGMVPPMEFIPLLEEDGDIVSVGKWILKTVCQQIKVWHDNGVFIERASVNVSPIQLSEMNFVHDVKQILAETKLAPNYLELEITEGTLLHLKQAEQTLNELQELGITISIDDFGTGYSSLSYLNKLPINTLKIDKSFIKELGKSEEVIVNTIISMGKNLNYKVLAEGIESQDQLAYLKTLECHEGQGYYFSKPVEASKIAALYERQVNVQQK